MACKFSLARCRMKGLPIFSLAIATALLLVPITTQAHHGTTAYDNAQTLKLQGTVTSFNWVNPHASLDWDVKTESGAIEHWVVELTSPGMLTRSGWHHDSVKPGDEVTVYFHPSKNGAKLGLFQRVTFTDGRPDLIDPRAP
jgi:hypothetical protein